MIGRFLHFRQRCWVSLFTKALSPCRSLFSIFASIFCGFWRYQILNEVLLVRMAKASVYQSGNFLQDKCFFEQNYIFLIFPKLWAQYFHTSDVNVAPVFSSLRCTWPENVFGGMFSKKKTAFNLCFDVEQNVFRISAVFFDFGFSNFIFHF